MNAKKMFGQVRLNPLSNSGLVAMALIYSSLLSGCGGVAPSSSSASVASSNPVVSSSVASSSSSSSASIPSGSTLVYAVNAGGSAVNVGGIDYNADRFSNGGSAGSTTDPIANTSEDVLYQSERWGKYKYEIPVTNSTYSLSLKFSEMFHEAAGGRYFSVTVEGQPVFNDLDLFAEAGHDSAYDFVVPNIVVADEKLTIELNASLDNATISAFAIYSKSGGQFVEPPITSCPLPSKFQWESSGAIVSPNQGIYGIKDPSIVQYEGKFHVFATINDGGWKSVYFNFSDWTQASNATQQKMNGTTVGNTVAPQVFFYRPHNKWYNFTQWSRGYSTTSDISNVNSWSRRTDFLSNGPVSQPGENELDYWVICDDNNCHLYFSLDNGKFYHSKTSRANFPKFNGYEIIMSDAKKSLLFEASNVYKVEGSDQYLLLIEAYNSGPRYFRSWTSTSLDGPWTPLADTEQNPFAGNNNVTWPGGKWSDGISHGEMIRSGYDEYMTIDPCNLQYLYQGASGSSPTGDYGQIPYKLGLLTLKK